MPRKETEMLRLILPLLLAPIAAGAGAVELPCEERLPEFELEDQFEDERTQDDVLGTVSVLIWADRDAREWSDDWRDMLTAALRGQVEGDLVQIRGWAHTKGAPFFVKGRIRGSFPEEPERWAVLDWDGVFEEHFEPREEHVTVFVFDREGCLVARESGQEVEARSVAMLVDAAQKVLVRDLERSER